MNKKRAQVSTDTPIILSILVFQAFIILCLGYLNVDTSAIEKNEYGAFSFKISNIITSISELGWGNSLLFAPLGICLIYIVAKLIRGGG